MIQKIRWTNSGVMIACLAVAALLPMARTAAQASVVSRPKPAVLIPNFAVPVNGAPLPASHGFAPAISGERVRNNALYGVSCITWTRCIAVGTQVAGSEMAFRPLAEQWTGTRWHVMSMPDPVEMPRAVLTKVSCQSRRSCVATGYHYGGHGYSVLAERWDGRRWRIVQSANRAGMWSAFFNSVGCQPRVGCIAIGGHSSRAGESRALAELWTNGRWRVLRAHWPAGARAAELNGISCASGSCVAVGLYQASSGQVLTLAERWTGRFWMLEHPVSARAPVSTLNDISCATARLCMAVGDSQWNRQFPLAELWRDGSWHQVPGAKVADGTLNGVSCQRRTWCMAVGAMGTRPLTEAWYGQRWLVRGTPTAGGRPADQLSQLSCRTGNDRCVTVGVRYAPDQSAGDVTLAEFWTGGAWHLMMTRNP